VQFLSSSLLVRRVQALAGRRRRLVLQQLSIRAFSDARAGAQTTKKDQTSSQKEDQSNTITQAIGKKSR
jgi:hypothetical protein